jgi:transposase-like protein
MERKRYSPEYKARLVLEALREEATVSEIAAREGINKNQLQNWKQEFIENSAKIFSASKTEKEAVKRLGEQDRARGRLEKKVGQLTLEVDFLKECCKSIHGAGWEEKVGYGG